MFQSTLISSVVVWDHILEVEDSKRLATRYDDVFEPQSLPKRVELEPSTPLSYLIQRKEAVATARGDQRGGLIAGQQVLHFWISLWVCRIYLSI